MKRMLLAAAIAALATGAAQARTTEMLVYKAENFRGQGDTIKGEVNNLENGFGREVSSMIVRGGTWEVCTGDHFSGRCRQVAEGEYPRLGWLNNRIVSVRFLGENVVARNDVDRDGWYAAQKAREARQEAREERREARAREAREEAREARREWREEQRYDRDRRDSDGYSYYDRSRTYR